MKELYKSSINWKRFQIKLGLLLLLLIVWAVPNMEAQAQERSVSGVISDSETGETLPGVTVLIKGSTNGTVTDFDGNYRLAVAENDILSYSFIGYTTQEVQVGNQTTINIKLSVDLQELQEVVVIGYGSIQKKDLTGSVAPVSEKDFNKGVLTSPSKLITGKVAGVQVTSNSGEPGGLVKITIRGAAKVGNGSSDDPLFVIDGVPIDNNKNPGDRDPLSFINPSDIENITVLKDASATAIYGSRGAHGVIIITTKGGEFNQKARFSYSGNFTISQNIGELGNLSTDNFRKYMRLKGGLRLDQLGDANTNWVDEVLQDAVGQSHNISISGGTESNRYNVSIGHQDLQGVVRTSGTQRSSISINFTQNLLNDDLTIKFNNKSAFTEDQYSAAVIGAAFQFDPTQAIRDPNSIYGGYFEWDNSQTVRNPVAQLELTQEEGKSFRSLGNVEFEYKLPVIEGLSAKVNLAYDINNGEKRKFEPSNMATQVLGNTNPPGYYELENFSRSSLLFEGYGIYKKDLPSINSSFDVTSGYSYQTFQSRFPKFSIAGLSTNSFGLNNPAEPVEDAVIKTELNPLENRLISFFGRVNYNLLNRYIFTASLRRDGSTRFANDNQWGWFPSAAFKWQLIDEPFMKSQSLFDDLGVRVGFGITGNQSIGEYLYVSTYTLSDPRASYQFGDEYVLTWRPNAVDPSIRWEGMRSINFGIDYAFKEGRINGSLDYYQKTSSNLLNEIPFPAGLIVGDLVLTNIGEVSNSGIEAVVSAVIIDKQDFQFSLGFNATYNRNEVKKLDNRSDVSDFRGYQTGSIAGDVGQEIQILRVGQPINAFEVYEHIYYNGQPADDRTDWNEDGKINQLDMYVDQNDDGIINEADRRPYKSPFPDFIFGLTGSANYKRFDLSFTFRSNIGNYVYNNNASQYGNVEGLINRVPNNVHESVLETNFNSRQLLSDHYVENASFLKLDNISLGYTFNFKESVSLRLYTTMSNLLTVTGYTGQDPEAGSSGIDNNLYPFSRTMLLGASLNF